MLTLSDLAHRAQSRKDIVVTPALTASSAYSSGNALGGLITIDTIAGTHGPIPDPSLSAILQDIVVTDIDNQKVNLNLYFYNAAPTAPVNKTAYAPSGADLLKLIGFVNVASADYVTINSLAQAAGANQRNLGLVLKPGAAAATALYMAIVGLGTPTWSSTSSLQIRLKFSQGM